MGLIHEALEWSTTRSCSVSAPISIASTSGLAPLSICHLLLWVEGGLPALIGWLMLPQIIVLMAFWTFVRPGGRLVGATTLAVVTVFLLAATGNSHMYARFWVVPLHLCMALLMVSWASRLRLPSPRACGRAARAPLGAPPASAPQPSASARYARAALTRRDTRTHRCKDRGNRTWLRST